MPRIKRLLVDSTARNAAIATRLTRLADRLTSPKRTEPPHDTNAPSDEDVRHFALRTAGIAVSDIVLVLADRPVNIANELSRAAPTATVHLLAVNELPPAWRANLRPNVVYTHCHTTDERIQYLSSHPQPQLIVERGNGMQRQKVSTFRELFPFIAPGGVYVTQSLPGRPQSDDKAYRGPDISSLLATITSLSSGGTSSVAGKKLVELARSVGRLQYCGDSALVGKAAAYQFNIRDNAANALLARRFGTSWGEVMSTRPGFQFESDATVHVHGKGRDRPAKPIYDVPDRHLRRYDGVDCWPLQRLRYSDYWLPDTFRHHLHKELTNRRLVNASSHMSRRQDGASGPTRQAAGTYFYFDTEYPGHFGHVLTEVVSRYWGWQAARALVPDIRPLVSLHRGQDAIPGFQREIFTALGVDVETIEYVRADECLHVDTMYAATPDFVNPQYVTPEMGAVWEIIGMACTDLDRPSSPERLFVSRRPKKIRTCLDGEAVESLFGRLGFSVIYPEDHDFRAQVTLFRHARVIAGFGGSGMFTSMFAPQATVLLISGESYNATNEEMIKAVHGGDIHYFWGDSLIKQPPGSWSWDAYQSNFTFDVDRFAPEIKDVVDRV